MSAGRPGGRAFASRRAMGSGGAAPERYSHELAGHDLRRHGRARVGAGPRGVRPEPGIGPRGGCGGGRVPPRRAGRRAGRAAASTRPGPRRTRADTLQLVFSTTKGLTAIAVALCVQRGLLDYDARVTDYWPEFAANGKGDVTVAQLLSHQAGLAIVDGALTLDEVARLGSHGRPAGRADPATGSRAPATATTPSRSVGWPASWCDGSIRRAGRWARSSPRRSQRPWAPRPGSGCPRSRTPGCRRS